MIRPSAFGRASRLLVVSATAALVSAAWAADDAVVSLTTKTFDDVVAKESLVLVKFTAPWCGHCQALTEPFAAAASDLKDTAVLADVDATAEEKLAEKYEIQGFPTIKMFVNGSFLTDYKGDRSTAAIVSFVKRATLPPFEDLADAAAVKTFAEAAAAADETTAVYAVAPTDEVTTAFRAAVFALRDTFPDTMKFASVASAAAAAELAGDSGKTIKVGDIVVVSADKSVEIKPDGDQGIDAWVKALAVPVFAEFSQANSELYTEGEKAVAVIFTKSNKKEGKGVAEMEKLAIANKGNSKLNFAYVDNSELSQFSDYLGLKSVVPQIAIYSFASDVKFLMPEESRGDKFTEAALSAWIKEYLDGKLVPLKKSQPIPESNDGPIKEVVGDTWESVVEDTEKDVLIMTHAEWCGHCKAAMPKLEAAAKALSGVSTVVIARMDGTENDAPEAYKAKGFPTIHFFSAGKEQKGMEYDGGRTAREFVAYLKEHATHKFEFDVDTVPRGQGGAGGGRARGFGRGRGRGRG
eukprot:TRINITY_DN81_c0_g1_i2.p1 TRINITY_DN81_c0_g1~~TRINITY_DN81_c0_g1_i2.p1  ORF type:complete len:523 (+),score=204.04 TRINITY_DN81_c0_g1_i2:185-1753(+)